MLGMTYETVDTSVDDGDLNLRGERLILALLCVHEFIVSDIIHRFFKKIDVLKSSVRREPRLNKKRVEASKSEPN